MTGENSLASVNDGPSSSHGYVEAPVGASQPMESNSSCSLNSVASLISGTSGPISISNSNITIISGNNNIVNGSEGDAPLVPPQEPITDERGGVKKLAEGIWFYKKPLQRKHNIFAGYQDMGMFRRNIAVKIVRHDEKREREAKNLRKLNSHPNVVEIIYANVIPCKILKNICIVMEQCQTISLDAYYRKRRMNVIPFNVKQALDFSYQVIQGLNHIHKNDIIHRDLKPSSVLFSLDGKTLKIIDFGMSKQLKQGMTVMSISTTLGEDGYRAPETYEKDEITRRADVFSLALLLYYLWSYGCHPYGDSPINWCHNIKIKKEPDLSKLLVPDVKRVKDLLLQMLEPCPRTRCGIDHVVQHNYICQGIERTLLTDMEMYCSGAVKGTQGRYLGYNYKMFCKVGHHDFESLGQHVTFQLKSVPQVDLRDFYPKMDRSLDGFLAIPKKGYTNIMKKLREHQKMGWINISKDGEGKGSIVMIKIQDYEELVCIYFQDSKALTSAYERGPPGSETVFQEPGIQEISHPTDDIQSESNAPRQSSMPVNASTMLLPDENVQVRSSDFRETFSSQNASATQEVDEDVWDCDLTNSIQEMPGITTEVVIDQPEYISWWIYKMQDDQ